MERGSFSAPFLPARPPSFWQGGEHTWKKKTINSFVARKLPVQIFDKGVKVYDSPRIEDIQKYCAEQIATLWPEVTRFENPHIYYVDLSKPLWDIKRELLDKYGI